MVGYPKLLITRRTLISGLSSGSLFVAGCGRVSDRGFTILGVNSYRRAPGVSLPYRFGMQLAASELNARGGVCALGGMQVNVIPINDGGEARTARTVLQAQLAGNEVAVVAGGCLEAVSQELSTVCEVARVPFISALPMRGRWSKASRADFTFHLGPSVSSIISMLLARLQVTPRTWAFIASRSSVMQSAVEAMEQQLRCRRPDVAIVVDSGRGAAPYVLDSVLEQVRRARPEAVFLALEDAEGSRLVRSKGLKSAFDGAVIVHLPPMPDPHVLDAPEAAQKRLVAPYYDVGERQSGPHGAFVRSFLRVFSVPPTFSALLGYIAVQSAVAAAEGKGSLNGEDIAAALSGGRFDTPVGEMSIRASDHQSTLGSWVLERMQGMTRVTYADAGPHLE